MYVDGIFVGKPGTGRNLFAEPRVGREETTDALVPRRHPSDDRSPARSVSPPRPLAGKNLLYRRNLLSVLDLQSKQEIIQILDLAKSFRDDIREGRAIQPLLQSHGMVQMFFEVSECLKMQIF